MPLDQPYKFGPFTPKKFGMNPLNLSFEPDLEDQFQQHYVKENFPYLRTAGIVATLIWAISNLVEGFYTPWEVLKPIWIYSLGIVLPIQIIFVSYALSQKGRKHILLLLEIPFLAVAFGLTFENVFIRPNTDFPTEVLYLILMFAVLTFVRFRFIQSLRITFVVAVLMFAGLFIQNEPNPRLVYDFVFTFAAILFGGFASYSLEYFSRRNWMLSLYEEKKKQLEIEAANLRSTQELARAVAHEFNNPLGILKLIYEVQIEPKIQHADEQERKGYEKIPATIQRMSDLVQELLTITELKSSEYVKGVQYLNISKSSKEQPDDYE